MVFSVPFFPPFPFRIDDMIGRLARFFPWRQWMLRFSRLRLNSSLLFSSVQVDQLGFTSPSPLLGHLGALEQSFPFPVRKVVSYLGRAFFLSRESFDDPFSLPALLMQIEKAAMFLPVFSPQRWRRASLFFFLVMVSLISTHFMKLLSHPLSLLPVVSFLCRFKS